MPYYAHLFFQKKPRGRQDLPLRPIGQKTPKKHVIVFATLFNPKDNKITLG
jgi:hypothetical protein